MNFDNDVIMKLAQYGKVVEAGDYSINAGPVAAGVEHHETNSMGDNPLIVPESVGTPEVTDEMCEKMHSILTKVGFDDSDIAVGGCKIKEASAAKIAKMLTDVEVAEPLEFVNKVIAQLSDNILQAQEPELVEDFTEPLTDDAQFTYSIDTLGNILIIDAVSGKEVFLQGQDALELRDNIEAENGDEDTIQSILSSYQSLMEDNESSSTEFEQGLKSLAVDVNNLKLKLQKLETLSKSSGDVQFSFTVKDLKDEFDKFEKLLTDHITG